MTFFHCDRHIGPQMIDNSFFLINSFVDNALRYVNPCVNCQHSYRLLKSRVSPTHVSASVTEFAIHATAGFAALRISSDKRFLLTRLDSLACAGDIKLAGLHQYVTSPLFKSKNNVGKNEATLKTEYIWTFSVKFYIKLNGMAQL